MSRIAGFLQTVRKEIQGLPRYNAGLSIDFVRQHYRPARISKLGSNENPYGPSPKVIAAIAAAAPDVWLYTEASCDGLRAELAARLAVDPELLIFGNGSEDLIAIAAHTFLASGSDVVTFAPSFGLHLIYPQSVGASVRVLQPRADYTMDGAAVAAALTPDTGMLIFGNPSNPSGASLSGDDLRTILAAASPETLIVFDEAYLEYASADPAYPDFHAILRESASPWLILRTFSKAYGLAGLRVGYAIASDPELIQLNGSRAHAVQCESAGAGGDNRRAGRSGVRRADCRSDGGRAGAGARGVGGGRIFDCAFAYQLFVREGARRFGRAGGEAAAGWGHRQAVARAGVYRPSSHYNRRGRRERPYVGGISCDRAATESLECTSVFLEPQKGTPCQQRWNRSRP